jgi:hypothetical protein
MQTERQNIRNEWCAVFFAYEITVDEMGKSCATYGEKGNAYRMLMGKLLWMKWASHVLHMGRKNA